VGRKVFLLLALICGLVAAGSTYSYLRSINKVSVHELELKPLVMVKTNITARTLIQADQLIVKNVPLQDYPQGGAKTIQSVSGAVALVTLKPGDPLLEAMIQRQSIPVAANQSTSSQVSSSPVAATSFIVPEGKRAVAIPINLISSVGYAVKPGDHVDVLVTIDVKDAAGNAQVITTLAAQDVLVLITGEKTAPDKSIVEAKYYTLALSVPQALAVTLAGEKGSLRLLLRNPVNKEIREDQPVSPSIFLDPNYSKRFQ